jgi:release factor glutamine methyltransferase
MSGSAVSGEPIPAGESTIHIDNWQKRRQHAFKSTPGTGRTIRYLGKEFWVAPNTFWPFSDSHPLVQSMQIATGDSVLDVGTGSGVIAVFACYKGAGRVLAVDINPDAVRSAMTNARLHGFDEIIEVRQSDLFENVGNDEQFDVITANMPFRQKPAQDNVARSQWDTEFRTNTAFFREVGKYLRPGGRIYFAHASFGSPDLIVRLAEDTGFSARMIGSKTTGTAVRKTFYALVLQRAR